MDPSPFYQLEEKSLVTTLFKMSSIDQSICLLENSQYQDTPQNCINRAVADYQGSCESEDEFEGACQQAENNYQGFENKKSIKIKPVRMFKDLICLQQQNTEKKKRVQKLEELNNRLRNQYEECMAHNDKLEHFFKEVEFTFQPEKKKVQNSEIMVRAKKNLYQEAKEARQRMKKMYKSTEASAIQELKTYIGVLEGQRQQLKIQTEHLFLSIDTRIREEDFNALQINKFNAGCQRIKKAMGRELETVKKRHQEYKQEKMLIKSTVKARHLQAEKKRYKEECEGMKGVLRELEGLEYEIELLKHRAKDKKKENWEYEDLKERISHKESTTIRLQKELRQKFKTYEYMLEWTKELKKQLEARKSEHAKKKAAFEDQINNLTTDYEKYSQLYKAGLFEEQAAERKGSRQMLTSSSTAKPVRVKLVAFEEIRAPLKSLSFFLLDTDQTIEQFIDDLLRVRPSRGDLGVKQSRKLKLKATFSVQKYHNHQADNVTIQDVCDGFEFSKSHNLTKEEYTKIAHFLVEDSKGIQEARPAIEIKIARQILKNLLKREIETLEQLAEAEEGVRRVLKLHGDVMRPELKLSGGVEEEIQISFLKQVLKKYGMDPYHSNIYSEFMEFWGWRKRRSIGFLKLVDFDEMVLLLTKLNKEVEEEFSESQI